IHAQLSRKSMTEVREALEARLSRIDRGFKAVLRERGTTVDAQQLLHALSADHLTLQAPNRLDRLMRRTIRFSPGTRESSAHRFLLGTAEAGEVGSSLRHELDTVGFTAERTRDAFTIYLQTHPDRAAAITFMQRFDQGMR